MTTTRKGEGEAGVLFLLAACLVLAALFWLLCLNTVPAGHVGVVSSFGAVEDNPQPAGGPHLTAPWKKVRNVNVQSQRNEEPGTVPTKSGLAVSLKSTMIYHLDPAAAPRMVREVGADGYEEKVIDPYLKNVVRNVTAEFPAESLYTGERGQVEQKIAAQLTRELEARGVVVESVMLLDPVLPDVVRARIESKVGAEQDAQRMEFVLRQKKLEADAKVIEAEGIAKAQKIIQQDLSHPYLVYLWIQALRDHSGATLYVPVGPDGLPLFKTADAPPPKK